MPSPFARHLAVWPHAGDDVKIIWVIAISTAIVFLYFLNRLGKMNLFLN